MMSTREEHAGGEEALGAYKPPAPVGGMLGRLLAMVYGRVIAGRNRKFDAGRGVIEIDRPVVSIGNLSTGGTGKTPTVIWMIQQLHAAGFTPCIAMRGYGGASGGSGGVGRESDEAMIYAARLPDVKVVAQANRVEGLLELFAAESEGDVAGGSGETDAVVLDDGFQHRRLARDFDLVLIDATRPPFEDQLLPAGHLREGMDSLRRAHGVLITRIEHVHEARVQEIRTQVLSVNPQLVVALGVHQWRGFDVLVRGGSGGGGGGAATLPEDGLRGRRVYAVCAIGNPAAFLGGIRQAGAEVVGTMVLRDHARYGEEQVRHIVQKSQQCGAEMIVTTEKDWSKLQRVRADMWPVDVVRPRLEMVIEEGDALMAAVVAKVSAAMKRKREGE